MADYSLFDLLGSSGSQPARYDVYDQPDVGPSPVLRQPDPQTADQSWTAMLGNMAKNWMASQAAQPQSSGSLQAARPSSSSKGLRSNSRQGLDIDTVIKIVGALYGGGAAGGMGGVAGAASGGGGMSAGIGGYGVGTVPVSAGAGGAASGVSAMGGMGSMFGSGGGAMGGSGSMVSSLLGGGGVSSKGGSKQGGLDPVLGGYQGKDVGRPTFADVPINRSPLVSQSVNMYDVPNYSNWLFQ